MISSIHCTRQVFPRAAKIAMIILSCLLLFHVLGCESLDMITLTYKDGQAIVFENENIAVQFDAAMNGIVLDKVNGITLTESIANPTHFIIADGESLTNFRVKYDEIVCKNISTDFGRGKRLILTGETMGKNKTNLQKTLTVELYKDFPNAAVMYSSYKNKSDADVVINGLVSNYFILDATNADAYAEPWEFWSFQGAAIKWGLDYMFPLTQNFHQENYMGVQPDTKNGGGVPVVDLWTKKGGIGIAHLEPVPKIVSLPVNVENDGRVSMCVQEPVQKSIKPGERITTLKTAVMVHSLDYFDCLRTFSKLMHAQGVQMKNPPETAYESIWCSWGYRSDFTAKDVLQTLPKLKAMGIPWVVIDDRWFDRYGDWNVREDLWPNGAQDFKALVDTLHQMGFNVKIWWDPPTAQPDGEFGEFPDVEPGAADMVKMHLDWLVMDENGNYPTDERGMYMPCPSVPEVQEYYRKLTEKFIRDWDFDGHKLDAYWTVPPCHNPAHHHERPEESHEDLPFLFKIIYETTMSLKHDAVVEICNCGTPQDFWQEAWINQPVTSDPVNALQVRRRVKVFKALMGSHAAVYADHVELTDIRMDDNWREIGRDFASAVGTGAVVGTKFTWPTKYEDLDVLLTPEKEKHWMKWMPLYNKMMLSKGEYLNLFDIAFDVPETHVVKKDDALFYAFYADSWNGNVSLRGLADKTYKVRDYVNDRDLGEIQGPEAVLSISLKDHLLIECTPVMQ